MQRRPTFSGAPDIGAKLAGTVNGKPANGTLRLLKPPAGGWTLDPFEIVVGSANIRGHLSLDPADLATGQLSLDARDFSDLAPLVLTPLSGDVHAGVVFDATGGKQNMQLDAQGQRMKVARRDRREAQRQGLAFGPLRKADHQRSYRSGSCDGSGRSLFADPSRRAGSPSGSDIALSAKARQFDLAARGRLVPDSSRAFRLATFTARPMAGRFRLRGPRRLSLLMAASLCAIRDQPRWWNDQPRWPRGLDP